MDDKEAFLYFCHENNVDMLEEAILAGCDLEVRDSRGRTGLHLAAIRGGTETLRLLLRAGLDANLKDHHGNTALHFSGHKEIIQLLIEYGAHVDARNQHGDTPLTLMCRRGISPDAMKVMTIGITEMENLQEGRRARHPSFPRPGPPVGVAHLKTIWHEFCTDIGLERLVMVLMFVLCASLYMAYTITGYSKQLDSRIPIDFESRHVEL